MPSLAQALDELLEAGWARRPVQRTLLPESHVLVAPGAKSIEYAVPA